MSTSLASAGLYFDERQADGELDPFAVLGLHPIDPSSTQDAVRAQHKTVVIKHVFERRNIPASTRGPRVPTWQHVNAAKEQLVDVDVATFQALRVDWRTRCLLTRSPSFPVCSAEATRLPPGTGFVSASPATAVPPPAAVAVHPSPATVCPPPATVRPFAVVIPLRAPAASPPRPATGDHWHPETPQHHSTVHIAHTSHHPSTQSRRRSTPIRVFLGTWKGSNWESTRSHAVYGTKSGRRFTRRISKETRYGKVVRRRKHSARVARDTICSHDMINYHSIYEGLSKAAGDALIRKHSDTAESDESEYEEEDEEDETDDEEEDETYMDEEDDDA